MNVLWIVSNWPTPRSPTSGTFIAELARHVATECDLEVLVLVPSPPPLPRYAEHRRLIAGLPATVDADGFTVHHLPVPYVPTWRLPENLAVGATLGLAGLAVARWVRQQQQAPDVVHAHMGLNTFYGAAVARRGGIPLVTTVQGSGVTFGTQPGVGNLVRRRATVSGLRASSALIGVSKFLCQRVTDLGVPRANVVHIPNGFDPANFRPTERAEARRALGIPETGKMLLYVGNLVPVKGVDVLLAAFGQLPRAQSDPVLYCVGDGPERARLEAKAAADGLTGRVLFIGRRPHDEIPKWMGACDAFVLPSLAEGFGLVLLEALACGRRVVGTAVGGVPEVVRDPSLGVVVPPESPEPLAAALRQVLDAEADPESIHASVLDYTWDKISARTADVYRRVLGSQGTAPAGSTG